MQIAISSSGRLAHVTEVMRGAACSCRCLSCNDEVVAKQGSKREWHFAHASDRPPCQIPLESLLHRFVKQTISEAGGIMAPPVHEGHTIPYGLWSARNGAWLQFDRIDSEVTVGDLRVDLMAWAGADRLAIEVAFSSFCDEMKVASFEADGLCALEIDVSRFDPASFDADAVRHAVLTNLEIKRWLWTKPLEELPAVVSEPVSPSIREVKRVLVAGRVVRLSVLRWGQVVIAYDYGPEVSTLIRRLAHRYHGRWDDRYKNWRLNGCWLQEVETALQVLHDPSSFSS